MAGLTIVAIPSPDDYSWRISSEKVPHMTLLQLGGSDKVDHIFEYLDHVADMTMHCFMMDVERRGTLGPEEADVLFFNKRYAREVCAARSFLLQDPVIKTAYDSVEQYEPWVPHLTLGYPKTPAKPDTRDYPGISYVKFDKIALWTGEYEGQEIELKSYDTSWADEAYMSEDDAFVADYLEHFGVKGMRWGVRKVSDHSSGASEDHVNATIARIKAKKGGTKALSNKELQDLITRMNLEQQYVKVVPPSKSAKFTRAGAKVVGEILLGVGKSQVTKIANDHATKLISKAFKK